MLLGLLQWILLFKEHRRSNSDISKWNVDRVRNLKETFFDAHSFNSDISKWNPVIGTATEGVCY